MPLQPGLSSERFSLEHPSLGQRIAAQDRFLLIQDLDGVCMGLVRDPLTRVISADYIHATKALSGNFFVLTNGEHIGKRGVNRLVETALGGAHIAKSQGLYLPGLAGGGVQWQDADGAVSHPGVSEAELAFLGWVPEHFSESLRALLLQAPYNLDPAVIAQLLSVVILDNPVSPTININGFFTVFGNDAALFLQLQQDLKVLLESTLAEAERQGLNDSFFIHYAPNLGSDEEGERLKWASAGDSTALDSTPMDLGTTDFQFMLQGAVKEVGVLVILNRYFQRLTGDYPLGEAFNAREAPRDQASLLALAKQNFDPDLMPCLLGVGDTLTSQHDPESDKYLRGGSDRGFLTLVQQLGETLNTDSGVIFVDSSAGELNRPAVDVQQLTRGEASWRALRGITDSKDPLQVNFVFPQGHQQYVEFFCELAQTVAARR